MKLYFIFDFVAVQTRFTFYYLLSASCITIFLIIFDIWIFCAYAEMCKYDVGWVYYI